MKLNERKKIVKKYIYNNQSSSAFTWSENFPATKTLYTNLKLVIVQFAFR